MIYVAQSLVNLSMRCNWENDMFVLLHAFYGVCVCVCVLKECTHAHVHTCNMYACDM